MAAALAIPTGEVLDLSASLNPVAPDPIPIVARHLDAVRHYPDPLQATESLAQAMGVPAKRLLLTNGGAEAIGLLSGVLGGRVIEPEFSLLPRRGDPLWRSDPNNPTGQLAPAEARADIWDEAFYPLATGRWTAGRPAMVVGSLTKLFACPGLRLGYVVVTDDHDGAALVERLRGVQPEWSVNGLALSALPDFLEAAQLLKWQREIADLRAALTGLLHRFDLNPLPSAANFVLCGSAVGLRERLAPEGVLVRDCASFGLAGQARIAVPDEVGLVRLTLALEATA